MRIKQIFEGEVIKGPWGDKPDEPRRISLKHVFAGDISLVEETLQKYEISYGAKFKEKPSYFSDLREDNTVSWHAVNSIMTKEGWNLPEYDGSEIYNSHHEDMIYTPQKGYKNKPEEDFWILETDRGNYLCAKTGAESYCRFWMKIV